MAQEQVTTADKAAFNPEDEGWAPRPPVGFTGLTGPFWTRPEGDGWAYGLMPTGQHLNGHGIVHGGLLMTLLDNAMGLTVWQAVGRKPVVTMQLNTHFLSAGQPGAFLEARGEVVRVANSVVFVRGAITAAGRQLAVADGIWKVLAARPGAPRPEDSPA